MTVGLANDVLAGSLVSEYRVIDAWSSYYTHCDYAQLLYCAGIAKSIARSCCEYIRGGNCTFFSCSTSAKHALSLFKLPTVSDSDGEHTKELKQPSSSNPADTRSNAAHQDADREEQIFLSASGILRMHLNW